MTWFAYLSLNIIKYFLFLIGYQNLKKKIKIYSNLEKLNPILFSKGATQWRKFSYFEKNQSDTGVKDP